MPDCISQVNELVDGTRYAERHVVDIVQTDGERIVQEIYVFGERDQDGRFARLEESTFGVSI